MDRDSRYFIESLSRGLRVLEAFSDEQSSLTLAQLATAVGLDKSTVFRLVHTLEEMGYLERDADSKRYRPGLKVLRLGFTALNNLGVAQLARPYLQRLSAEVDEAISMALRDDAEIVYIVRISPLQIVTINLREGALLPAHCTSMGKMLLSPLSEAELRKLLGRGPLRAYTPRTITRFDDLIADLARVRARGYAVGDEELAIGLRSLAAPIRDNQNTMIAAINVSVASARYSRAELEARMAAPVMDTARQISFALGAVMS